MPPKLIAHLDADCFYVSCERVRNDHLRRQPVGVLGNQGACVIAKSYEMKALGVKTGMPIWDAVKCCPQGIYVKRDFHWYEVISRQLLDMLRLVSPQVEYYSIDEMFWDADQLPHPLLESARILQRRVLDEIGIPVSMGISTTKTLAKLLSDTAKPLGCAVLLDQEETQAMLKRISVGEISGIGKRSEQKLAAHGIMTCGDFAQADRRLIRKLLTVKGEALWWELHGTQALPILTLRPPHKAISRGGSLGEATADPDRLIAWAVRNVERLIEELDFYQVFTNRLVLSVDYHGGGGWCNRVTLPGATASFLVLATAIKSLVLESCRGGHRITGMDLLAEQLCGRSSVQRSLFDNPDPNLVELAKVKALINQQVGRFAVRSGDTLPIRAVYGDETNNFDICDVHGKMCF